MNLPGSVSTGGQRNPFTGFNPQTYVRSIGVMGVLISILILICYFLGLSPHLGYYPALALKKFQLWRPLLFPFASSGIINLIINIFSTLFLSWMLEKQIGSINFLVRIFADALLLSLLVEAPIYFLFDWMSPTLSKTVMAVGMAPILALETFSLLFMDYMRKTSFCGLPFEVPMLAIPAICLLATLPFGDLSVLFAIIAGFLHLKVFNGCGMAALPAQTAFNLEKRMMPLDRGVTFYTMNDKSALSAGHPVLGAGQRPNVPLLNTLTPTVNVDPILPPIGGMNMPMSMAPDQDVRDVVRDAWSSKFPEYAPLPGNNLFTN